MAFCLTTLEGSFMCGIIGDAAQRQTLDYLVNGLRRRDYSGYGSAGAGLGSREGLSPENWAVSQEISEQVLALASGIAAWDEGIPLNRKFDSIERIVAVGSGSSCNAALAAKVAFQEFARLPFEVVPAGEFKSSGRVLGPKVLLLAVSSTVEPAGTFAAVQAALAAGSPILVLTGAPDSALAENADQVIATQAGLECGPVSTKYHTSQLLNLLMLAIYLGRIRGGLTRERFETLLRDARRLPGHVEGMLRQDTFVRFLARKYQDGHWFAYMGRRYHAATAREGALKMTEIGGLASEAWDVDDVKPGRLAIVDHRTVCVAVAPRGVGTEKTLSFLRDVRARGAIVTTVATDGDLRAADVSDHVLEIPTCEEPFSTILGIVPLQLLSFHRAVALEREADKLASPVKVGSM